MTDGLTLLQYFVQNHKGDILQEPSHSYLYPSFSEPKQTELCAAVRSVAQFVYRPETPPETP